MGKKNYQFQKKNGNFKASTKKGAPHSINKKGKKNQ